MSHADEVPFGADLTTRRCTGCDFGVDIDRATELDVGFWQISVKVAGRAVKIGVRGGNSKIRKSLWLKDFHPRVSLAHPRRRPSQAGRRRFDPGRPLQSFTVRWFVALAQPIHHRSLGGAEFDPFRAVKLYLFVELLGKFERLLADVVNPIELTLKRKLSR
jgi:hypothetical protein